MNRFGWQPGELVIEGERADVIEIPTDKEELAKRAKIAEGPLPETASNTGTITNVGPGILALSPSRSKKLDGILGRKRLDYSEDQPRAEDGKFGSGSGGSKGSDADETYFAARPWLRGQPGGSKPYAELTPAEQTARANWKPSTPPATETSNGTFSSMLKAADKGRTAADHAVIEKWIGAGYEKINASARAGKATKDTKALDAVIAKSKAPENLTVYRGCLASENMKEGATFSDKGFVATSTQRPTAKEFADYEHSLGRESAIVRITVPKGHKAAAVPTDRANGKGDAEILMPRNSKFKVTSVSHEGDHLLVNAEAL